MLDLHAQLRGRLLRLATAGLASALSVGVTAGSASAATCQSFTSGGSPAATVCGEDFGVVGGQVSGEIGTFSDPQPFAFQPLPSSIDWGDGSSADSIPPPTAGPIDGTHAYAASGVYTVTITVHGRSIGGNPTIVGTGTATVWQVAADGQTNPGSGAANTFSIRELAGSGTVTYTGTNSFNGTIQCADVVGNRAMIVAKDTSTGLWDRTVVEDNGASGDKLVNTMFTPPTNRKTNLTSCSDPTNVTLPDRTLAGDAISVLG